MQPNQTPQPWAAQPSHPTQEQWVPQAAPAPWAPATGPDPGGWAPPPQPSPPPAGAPPEPGQAPPGWPVVAQQPWLVPFSPHLPVPPARRGPGRALVIGLVAVVGLLGAGAGGAHAYAKHSVCSMMEDDSAVVGEASGSSSAGAVPTAAEFAKMRDGADELRGYGRMLVFDGDLRSAVNGLADDLDQIADLFTSAGSTEDVVAGRGFTELVTIAGSLNSHARAAQRGCGLPVKGIFRN